MWYFREASNLDEIWVQSCVLVKSSKYQWKLWNCWKPRTSHHITQFIAYIFSLIIYAVSLHHADSTHSPALQYKVTVLCPLHHADSSHSLALQHKVTKQVDTMGLDAFRLNQIELCYPAAAEEAEVLAEPAPGAKGCQGQPCLQAWQNMNQPVCDCICTPACTVSTSSTFSRPGWAKKLQAHVRQEKLKKVYQFVPVCTGTFTVIFCYLHSFTAMYLDRL